MPVVTLNLGEMLVCQTVGRLRSLIARGYNVSDAKMGNQDGSDADVDGFMAEYAMAKQFNTFPDFGLSPRSGSADGEFKGYRYDVKSTRYANGKLLCTIKHNPDVDLYVLAIIDGTTVNIVGYAMASDLRQDKNIKDMGYGGGYALDQSELQKFKGDKP